MAQAIGAFVTKDGGEEDYKLVFMVARFVRKWHEGHKVLMAGSEWLLLEM